MANRKPSAILAFLLLIPVLAHPQQRPCESCSVVNDALTAYNKLHTGMTRAELEQKFRPDGGLSGPTYQVYVFRDCPMIKIDVRFERLTNPADYFKADNKVQNFGRLYIDYEVMD